MKTAIIGCSADPTFTENSSEKTLQLLAKISTTFFGTNQSLLALSAWMLLTSYGFNNADEKCLWHKISTQETVNKLKKARPSDEVNEALYSFYCTELWQATTRTNAKIPVSMKCKLSLVESAISRAHKLIGRHDILNKYNLPVLYCIQGNLYTMNEQHNEALASYNEAVALYNGAATPDLQVARVQRAMLYWRGHISNGQEGYNFAVGELLDCAEAGNQDALGYIHALALTDGRTKDGSIIDPEYLERARSIAANIKVSVSEQKTDGAQYARTLELLKIGDGDNKAAKATLGIMHLDGRGCAQSEEIALAYLGELFNMTKEELENPHNAVLLVTVSQKLRTMLKNDKMSVNTAYFAAKYLLWLVRHKIYTEYTNIHETIISLLLRERVALQGTPEDKRALFTSGVAEEIYTLVHDESIRTPGSKAVLDLVECYLQRIKNNQLPEQEREWELFLAPFKWLDNIGNDAIILNHQAYPYFCGEPFDKVAPDLKKVVLQLQENPELVKQHPLLSLVHARLLVLLGINNETIPTMGVAAMFDAAENILKSIKKNSADAGIFLAHINEFGPNLHPLLPQRLPEAWNTIQEVIAMERTPQNSTFIANAAWWAGFWCANERPVPKTIDPLPKALEYYTQAAEWDHHLAYISRYQLWIKHPECMENDPQKMLQALKKHAQEKPATCEGTLLLKLHLALSYPDHLSTFLPNLFQESTAYMKGLWNSNLRPQDLIFIDQEIDMVKILGDFVNKKHDDEAEHVAKALYALFELFRSYSGTDHEKRLESASIALIYLKQVHQVDKTLVDENFVLSVDRYVIALQQVRMLQKNSNNQKAESVTMTTNTRIQAATASKLLQSAQLMVDNDEFPYKDATFMRQMKTFQQFLIECGAIGFLKNFNESMLNIIKTKFIPLADSFPPAYIRIDEVKTKMPEMLAHIKQLRAEGKPPAQDEMVKNYMIILQGLMLSDVLSTFQQALNE